MRSIIEPYMSGEHKYTPKGRVMGLKKPSSLKGGFDMGADKNGFFIYTHRTRSNSSPEKIPQKDRKFVESTG